MFRDFANSVTVVLIVAPIVYMYIVTGWWLPTLLLLIGCASLQELKLRCPQAWEHCTELYQFAMVLIIGVGAYFAVVFGFFSLSNMLNVFTEDSEIEWHFASGLFCFAPSVFYMGARWASWAQARGIKI